MYIRKQFNIVGDRILISPHNKGSLFLLFYKKMKPNLVSVRIDKKLGR